MRAAAAAGADVLSVMPDGRSVLSVATSRGDARFITAACDAGAAVSDADGVAALHHLRGDALRHAPAAATEWRVFVAEDEDFHFFIHWPRTSACLPQKVTSR